MFMRRYLWLVLASACWTGGPEPGASRPSAGSTARHVTCEQYWAHIDDVFGTPDDVSSTLPITREHCMEFERFTEEQRRCFLSATTPETMSLCAIPDPQQRAEARKMLPMVKRAWPGTATPDEVRNMTKGCAFLGIAPQPDWRTKTGVLVWFLLSDTAGLLDPKQITVTVAPSTWTCVATKPTGMCDELQRRCGPNASPQ